MLFGVVTQIIRQSTSKLRTHFLHPSTESYFLHPRVVPITPQFFGCVYLSQFVLKKPSSSARRHKPNTQPNSQTPKHSTNPSTHPQKNLIFFFSRFSFCNKCLQLSTQPPRDWCNLREISVFQDLYKKGHVPHQF